MDVCSHQLRRSCCRSELPPLNFYGSQINARLGKTKGFLLSQSTLLLFTLREINCQMFFALHFIKMKKQPYLHVLADIPAYLRGRPYPREYGITLSTLWVTTFLLQLYTLWSLLSEVYCVNSFNCIHLISLFKATVRDQLARATISQQSQRPLHPTKAHFFWQNLVMKGGVTMTR